MKRIVMTLNLLFLTLLFSNCGKTGTGLEMSETYPVEEEAKNADYEGANQDLLDLMPRHEPAASPTPPPDLNDLSEDLGDAQKYYSGGLFKKAKSKLLSAYCQLGKYQTQSVEPMGQAFKGGMRVGDVLKKMKGRIGSLFQKQGGGSFPKLKAASPKVQSALQGACSNPGQAASMSYANASGLGDVEWEAAIEDLYRAAHHVSENTQN